MGKGKDSKLLWITGLKGIAALMVYIHHFFLVFYPIFYYGGTQNKFVNLIIQTPLNVLAYIGNNSVCLFYLISGFLIAYIYFCVNKGNQKISSIFKRYFQLMIPVLLSSMLIFAILKSGVFKTTELMNLYKQNGFATYYNDIDISFVETIKESIYGIFTNGSSVINPPLWTMKYELFFSILTMMILYIFGKHKSRFFVYGFIILFNLNSYLSCFILGVILLELYYNKKEILKKLNKPDLKIIILLLGIYLSSFTYLAENSKFYSLLSVDLGGIDKNILFHSLGAFMILLFVLLSDFSKKVLSKKVFVKAGDISLNLYLFHWIIINTFSMYITYKLLPYFNYLISVLISFLVTTFIVIAISKYLDKYIKTITNYCCLKITKKLD